MALTKSATTKFANDPANKPIIDFVKQYSLPTAEVNKSLAFYIDESGGDMEATAKNYFCLLYTSPSPRDRTRSRMPSSA